MLFSGLKSAILGLKTPVYGTFVSTFQLVIMARPQPHEVGRYAERSGLYVLTQTDEGGAAILNRAGFKAKEFG